MAEEVNVTNQTSNEKKPENYRVSDVQQIYQDAHPSSWGDVVNYIQKKGDSQWHITPGEAKSMASDFEALAKSGKPFTSDPQKAFQEAQQQHGSHAG